MMLYFLPGCTTDKPDLAAYGLRHAFEGLPTLLMGQTLDGVEGAVAVQQCDATNLQLAPKLQTWRKAPGGRYSFGWWNGEEPTPESLQRSTLHGGVPVAMADGKLWLVPQLRLWETKLGFTCKLPVRVSLNDDGEWTQGKVLPQFERLDEIANRLLDGMIAAEDARRPAAERPARLTMIESLDLAVELLAVNYRVSRVELSELGLGVLANDGTLRSVLRAACDFDAMEADILGKLQASAG